MINITGSSDDLIVIRGDIREEWARFDQEDGNYLAFSDGTVCYIVYDNDGIWRITRTCQGTAKYIHAPGDVVKDTNDIVSLEGKIEWVVIGDEISTVSRGNDD